MTPWREPLSHVFDNESRQNTFYNFHSFEIEHTEEEPSLTALYMGAWLSSATKAKVKISKVKGFAPGLQRVVLHSNDETIEFVREGPACATLKSTNGRSRRYNFGEPSLTALMTEELAVPGSDPAFNAAFARVKELVAHD